MMNSPGISVLFKGELFDPVFAIQVENYPPYAYPWSLTLGEASSMEILPLLQESPQSVCRKTCLDSHWNTWDSHRFSFEKDLIMHKFVLIKDPYGPRLPEFFKWLLSIHRMSLCAEC